MFGSLKDKFLGRRKHGDIDYNDIRSQVVGERAFLQQEPATVGEKFGFERPGEFPRDPYAHEQFAQPPQPEPFYPQQPAFGQRPDPRTQRMDFGMEQPVMEPKRDYDVLERLNLIESQLAAIRSQTETINERLKNIDARLTGRRY